MSRFENITHPSVELKLPLDGAHHRWEIPVETTLFFWGAIVAGTRDRLPPIDTACGVDLFYTALEHEDQISWSISLADGEVPLLFDTYYREAGYRGMGWWIAHEPVELPTVVDVRFETTGTQPTKGDDSVVLWTEHGTAIPWGATIESTIELLSVDRPVDEFPTKRENLWDEHTVYEPQQEDEWLE